MKYRKNNKIKKKLTSIISMLLIVILLITSNTITAFAESFFSFNGDGGAGGKVGSGFGFSSRNTGWLVYMVDDAGNLAPGCSTVLLYSPGANLSGNKILQSRCGQAPNQQSASYVSGAWNCLPWDGSNQSWTSNTSKIKEWFLTKNASGDTNAGAFIKEMGWSEDLLEGFKADEYDIVLELVARAQFGRKVSDKPNQGPQYIDLGSIINTINNQRSDLERFISEARDLARKAANESNSFKKANLKDNLNTKLGTISSAISQINRNVDDLGFSITDTGQLSTVLNDIADKDGISSDELERRIGDATPQLHRALDQLCEAVQHYNPNKQDDNSQGGYEPVPDECFVGTLLNLSSAGTEAYRRYCSSLLLERMPVSEYLTHDDDSFRAGATSRLSTWMTDPKQGNGMLIIHCKDPGQTTCDEPLAPSQHAAPKESTGTFTILKDYRTKKGEEITEYTASSLVRDSVDGNITIENEKGWKVVEWATSSSTTPTNGRNWNPGGKIQSGKTPRTVQLKKSNNEKGLYVLLEKTEDEEIEELEYDYELTETRITRRINIATPDVPNLHVEPDAILKKTFIWNSPNNILKCDGHICTCSGTSGWADRGGSGTCSCWVSDTRQRDTGLKDDPHTPDDESKEDATWIEFDCEEHYCEFEDAATNWSKGESKLHLSLMNSQIDSYPSIVSTKEGWNIASVEKGVNKEDNPIKGWYGKKLLDRDQYKSTDTIQYGSGFGTHGADEGRWNKDENGYSKNWNYTFIIMRGKDKLTIAEWVNAGEGKAERQTEAIEDLQDASSEGFAVGNTPMCIFRSNGKPIPLETVNSFPTIR